MRLRRGDTVEEEPAAEPLSPAEEQQWHEDAVRTFRRTRNILAGAALAMVAAGIIGGIATSKQDAKRDKAIAAADAAGHYESTWEWEWHQIEDHWPPGIALIGLIGAGVPALIAHGDMREEELLTQGEPEEPDQ